MAFGGIRLATAFVPITGDNSPLRRVLNDTQGLLRGWTNNVVQGIGQGIGQALFNNIQRGIQTGMRLVRDSLSAASDLNESLSKTVVAFGDSANSILAWSKTSATALGQSRQQALEAAASFGLLFSSMGLATDQSADMSRTLVELATDIASINNLSIDEALIKLRAGLVGETEPLRTVGVLLNAAAVETEALRSGLADTTEAITEQDKVMARYNLILQQTQKTQGDFARTSQGIANQERILAAQRQDALAQIGAAFSPIYLVILRSINRLLTQIAPQGENIVRSLAEGMVKGIIYILPALGFIKDVITYWLRPGSPPRLLPDLVKWGRDTFQVYLDSWGSADFGVLQTLGGTIENILRSFVTSGDIAETDIVSRVFGTRAAIINAVTQWRNSGRITEDSIKAIDAAAGAAGFSIAGLVRSYFDLEGASRRLAAAQQELSDLTDEYDRRLRPLNDQLDAINEKEEEIRNRQERSAARRTLRDPRATQNERRLAQLAIERIAVSEQIDDVEDERDIRLRAAEDKLQAAQREERMARAIFDAQQALLEQQVAVNRLVGEENELRKQQAAEIERIYQASLALNLALADDAGKLALLRLELERFEPGTVEHFNLLTQIAGLEQKIAADREGDSLLGPDSILPDMAEIDIPKWAEELAETLQKEINKHLGIGITPVDPEALIRQGVPPEVAKQIGEDLAPPEVTQQVKDFVKQIENLTGAIQGLVGPIEFLATLFGYQATQSELAAAETETAMDDIVLAAQNAGSTLKNTFNLDWGAAFISLRSLVAGALLGIANLFPTPEGEESPDANSPMHGIRAMGRGFVALLSAGFLLGWGPFISSYLRGLQWLRDQLPGSEPADASSPLTDLSDAGESFIDNIWDGMKTKWEELKEWWIEKMQYLRDLLPFSEPRDASSPLAGLPEAGKAILSQIQLGIDASDLRIPPPDFGAMAGALPAGASSSRSITIEEGAFQFFGESGERIAVFEDALRKVLQEVIDA